MNRYVKEWQGIVFCVSARGNHKIDILWLTEKIKEKMRVRIVDIL